MYCIFSLPKGISLYSRNLQTREISSAHVKENNTLIWSYVIQAMSCVKARALCMEEDRGASWNRRWGPELDSDDQYYGMWSGKEVVHRGCGGIVNIQWKSLEQKAERTLRDKQRAEGTVHKRPWKVGLHSLMKSITHQVFASQITTPSTGNVSVMLTVFIFRRPLSLFQGLLGSLSQMLNSLIFVDC